MTSSTYEFERPITEVEELIEETRRRADDGDEQAKGELPGLEQRLESIRKQVYSNLSPWERVQLARHKDRPRSLDYIQALCTEFVELHGDRGFADDKAVVAGTARFEGRPVVVVGQQKGKDTKENVERNFGMMHPEGYRKALRVMRLGDKFAMPILIFIDTPGAYPGIGAEERGQAESIARNIQEMMGLRVPIIATVIGEGASGGALGIGLADRLLMLENSWYCVISPEGCAAILWKDASIEKRAEEAKKLAASLKLSAPDLMELKVIDEIIPEPLGGAHRNFEGTVKEVRRVLTHHLKRLGKLSADELLASRFEKYRQMGVYEGE